MGCIPGSKDAALSAIDSISDSTSNLPLVSPHIGAAVASLMIISIIFMRAKFPPAALDALAKQISEVEDTLRDGIINNVLDPQVVLDYKLRITRLELEESETRSGYLRCRSYGWMKYLSGFVLLAHKIHILLAQALHVDVQLFQYY